MHLEMHVISHFEPDWVHKGSYLAGIQTSFLYKLLVMSLTFMSLYIKLFSP